MSVADGSVIITTRAELVNIDISPENGAIDITTIPEYIRVNVASSITTSGGTFVIGETPLGAINGSNATFTTLQGFVPNSVQLFVNGVSQTNGTDYVTIGTNILSLMVSPIVGDTIRVNYKQG